MAEDNFYRNTWVGVGAKYGGQFAVIGWDNSNGAIFNIAHPTWCFAFNLDNLRWGPGLGGGIGTTVIIAFNTVNITTLSGTEISDWGFNLSVAAKWDKIAQGLVNIKKYAALAKLGQIATAGKDMENIKLSANYLWNAYDMGNRPKTPVMFSLDLPVGWGLEVSLVKTTGTFEII